MLTTEELVELIEDGNEVENISILEDIAELIEDVQMDLENEGDGLDLQRKFDENMKNIKMRIGWDTEESSGDWINEENKLYNAKFVVQ